MGAFGSNRNPKLNTFLRYKFFFGLRILFKQTRICWRFWNGPPKGMGSVFRPASLVGSCRTTRVATRHELP